MPVADTQSHQRQKDARNKNRHALPALERSHRLRVARQPKDTALAFKLRTAASLHLLANVTLPSALDLQVRQLAKHLKAGLHVLARRCLQSLGAKAFHRKRTRGTSIKYGTPESLWS